MAGFNTTDTFIVKVEHKRIVFVRTDEGRFFDVTNCKLITAKEQRINNRDGLLAAAKQVSAEFVADLVAEYGVVNSAIKRKAISMTSRQQEKQRPTQQDKEFTLT